MLLAGLLFFEAAIAILAFSTPAGVVVLKSAVSITPFLLASIKPPAYLHMPHPPVLQEGAETYPPPPHGDGFFTKPRTDDGHSESIIH